MRSSTCLEESSPPDATTSHSDFLTVPCCSPFPGNRQVSPRISRQTSTFLRRWREEFRFGFALHITPPNPVSFFIEKPPVETLKVLYSKTSLEEVTWGCSSRTSLPTIIPLRTVNRQRAFTAYSWRSRAPATAKRWCQEPSTCFTRIHSFNSHESQVATIIVPILWWSNCGPERLSDIHMSSLNLIMMTPFSLPGESWIFWKVTW